jgi:(p)ppGpp synthase/HD superfamily hydrolase
VADEGINMSSVNVSTHSDNTATFQVSLLVAGVQQLRDVLARLEGLHDILEIRREKA